MRKNHDTNSSLRHEREVSIKRGESPVMLKHCFPVVGPDIPPQGVTSATDSSSLCALLSILAMSVVQYVSRKYSLSFNLTRIDVHLQPSRHIFSGTHKAAGGVHVGVSFCVEERRVF